jgi:hypothetical protein
LSPPRRIAFRRIADAALLHAAAYLFHLDQTGAARKIAAALRIDPHE